MNHSQAAFFAPTGVTLVLLLALWRLWLHRRFAWEWVGFLLVCGSTVLWGNTWSPIRQIGALPIILLVELIGLLAVSAWRFSPDWGQQGWTWVWDATLAPAFAAGLSLAAALLLLNLVAATGLDACVVPLLWLAAAGGLALSQGWARPQPSGRAPRRLTGGEPDPLPESDV